MFPLPFISYCNYTLGRVDCHLHCLIMRWKIIAVGKPSLGWAKLGVEDYAQRIQRLSPIEVVYVKDGTADQVTQRMLDASEGSLRALLDEKGKGLRSVDLAKWLDQRQLEACKSAAILIGGASGHHPKVREAARESWSLSAFTLQHELALVVLLEQIYRAHTILKKEPYHRE